VTRAQRPLSAILLAIALGLLSPPGPAGAQDGAGGPVDFKALYHQAVAFHESVAEARERLRQSEGERGKVVASLRPSVSVEGSISRRPDTLTSTATTPSGPVTYVLRPEESRDFILRVDQTLYTGGRASNELKIANIDEAAKEVGVAVAKEDLVFDLARDFFDVLKAQADLAAVTERREGMERHLKAARARVRLGADVKASALRLESEVARLKAEEAGDRHALASARENLANLTGASPDVALGTPPDMGAILSLTDPVDAAMAQRADLQLASGEAAAARLGVRYTTGNFLPLLKLEGNYERHGEDPSGSFLIDEEAFATLRATWDLYSGGGDLAERRRTRAVFREKQLALARLKRDARTQVEQADREVHVAAEIVDSLTEALRYAKENHRIVSETYKAGAATYLDVIDASTALGDAQRDLEKARHDHSLALLQLARVTGRLLTLVDEPLPSFSRLHRRVEAAD